MPPFHDVPLATLQHTHRTIQSRCIECGAVLPVDMGAVIGDHGGTATLAKVGYSILCPVCEAAGLLLTERPRPSVFELPN
jgi:hypothetical protein